jgi:hypothetical protein
MRFKTLIQQATVLAAVLAAGGPAVASPTPVAPTRAPMSVPQAPATPAGSVVTGASATGQVYAGVTVEQVAALLSSKGYKAEVHAVPNVGPVVASATNGVNYLIFFYGCSAEGVKSCQAMQFVAIWNNTLLFTTDDANRCNDKMVFGKLVALPDKVGLTHAVTTDGVTDRFLEVQLAIWEGAIANTRQCYTESKRAAPPAKGDATPHAANLPLLPPALSGQAPASVATSAVPPADFNVMPH